MPGHRLAAEAGGKALEEGFGERDLGEKNQRLAAVADRFGDRLEIDLGLAGASDSVEQIRRESGGIDGGAELGCRLGLRRFERRRIVVGIGLRIRVVYRHLDGLDRPGLHQAPDHAVGNAADDRQLAGQPHPLADPLQSLGALRGQPVGDMAGPPIFDDRTRPFQSAGRGHRHAQHRRDRRQIIIRRPLDQPPKRHRERRQVVGVEQRSQPIVADLPGLQPLGLPDRADQLARPQGRDHDRARLDLHAVRHPIIERAESCVEDDDAGAGHCTAISLSCADLKGREADDDRTPLARTRARSARRGLF